MPQKSTLNKEEEAKLIREVSKFFTDMHIENISSAGREVLKIFQMVLNSTDTDLVVNTQMVKTLTDHYEDKKDNESLKKLAVLTTHFGGPKVKKIPEKLKLHTLISKIAPELLPENKVTKDEVQEKLNENPALQVFAEDFLSHVNDNVIRKSKEPPTENY